MAKVLDVVVAAGALRDVLFVKSAETEDVARKQVLLGRHLQLEEAAHAFAAAPTSGPASASYDPAGLTKLFPAEAVSVYTVGAALFHGRNLPS